MKRRLLGLLGGLAAVAGTTLTGAGTAVAAPAVEPAAAGEVGTQAAFRRDCPTITCTLGVPDFPGGTMSVDADADGRGQATWVLMNKWGHQYCKTPFRLEAPAQSWVCHNMPGGNWRLTLVLNYGQDTHWAQIGARW
ncbi:hypothetical protein [Amycolatopsis sp. cmx-11-51]|uniref:hypothetical protein n=1 Tax=unclassified Amycolatopsis TaxID=2618356 RepID=UPI0039E4D2F9